MKAQSVGRATGAAVFALVLAHCGGGGKNEGTKTGAAGGTGRVDACELVPKSEMETMVGAPLASTTGNFSEHTYTKPTSYTATCMYMGARAVVLAVNYPRTLRQTSSEQLAARVTEQLRSQVGNDPSTDEVFRTTQVRPVEGLAGPAAEYTMLDQTNLEVHTPRHTVKVIAPSLDAARRVAAKAIGRLN